MTARARFALAIALAPFALAGCKQEGPARRPAVAPMATVVGEPVSCIPLSQIRETKIRDDWTIDFITSNDRAWRNTLTSRCPGLRSENAFSYKTSLSQLCDVDLVNVLHTAGGLSQGAGCGLGKFVPVKLEKR